MDDTITHGLEDDDTDTYTGYTHIQTHIQDIHTYRHIHKTYTHTDTYTGHTHIQTHIQDIHTYRHIHRTYTHTDTYTGHTHIQTHIQDIHIRLDTHPNQQNRSCNIMHHSRHILVVSCSLQNKKNYPTTLDHLPASLISLAIFSNTSNNFKHTHTHRLYSIVPQLHQQFITTYQLWSLINYLFNKTSSYSSQLFSYTSLELCLRATTSLILSTNLLSSGQHVDNKIDTHRHTEHTCNTQLRQFSTTCETVCVCKLRTCPYKYST